MSDINNYPSCIKIPPSNSRPSMGSLAQKVDVKEVLDLNNKLISLANQVFGEGKWNHAVTNQTIDFIDSFMGKYVCGCATFVKIQLENGTFHEDMGYCYAEGLMKGLSVYSARTGSLTEALKKVLLCFGDKIQEEIKTLMKDSSDTEVYKVPNDDFQCSLSNLQTPLLEPCAQSTPYIARKPEQKETETISVSKTVNPPKIQSSVQPIPRAKSPIEHKVQPISSTTPQIKNSGIPKAQETCNGKEQNNVTSKDDKKKVLSEDELLRMERKRKQMEKQAEYKRFMKEKEMQRANENKKPNPKY